MFGALTEKFTGIFSSLMGGKKLTEDNLSDAVREVRLALLDADVNYSVAKNFIKKVKEKALGDEVIKSIKPGEQFIKLIHDELVELMGGGEAKLNLTGYPAVVMLCGLQGSGKTTQAAKLAKYLQKKHKVILAACDLQRPAAVLQLQQLGEQAGVEVFAVEGEKNPVAVAKAALKHAKSNGFNVLILDTAGRLHVDEEMMVQLEKIKEKLSPTEILFVANAATGQDAVKAAAEFDRRLTMTGSILTMLDSDTRAGAAISIREVTGKPLKFEGIGERLDDLQLFDARSMADRILGMGDAINLVKKAQEYFSDEEAKKLEEKVRKASFTYEDYLKQMQAVRKMGSIKGLLKMLPGGSKLPNLDQSEEEFAKIESMILSMTIRERQEKDELSISRTKRVARGSGTILADVNKLKKSFKRSKQLFKKAPNKKMLEKMMRG
ncbi:MAG: Signal recognition particle protein [Chlamydiae bacterium]|nr:Signal recognition particle protein [Chlamydiota bacterium]